MKKSFKIIYLIFLMPCLFLCLTTVTPIKAYGFENTQRLLAGMSDTYYMVDGMKFCPDGLGGFYFMNGDDHDFLPQSVYYWNGQHVIDYGITPDALGFEIGDFSDIGCDAKGNLYLLVDYISDGSHLAIVLINKNESPPNKYLISPTTMDQVLFQAGLTSHQFMAHAQMAVTHSGHIWLMVVDFNDICRLLYISPQGTVLGTWRFEAISTGFGSIYSFGLAADEDLLITDIERAVVWRCDPQQGITPYINFSGFPTTISNFAELSDGSIVFATNYTINVDYTESHSYSGSTSLLTTLISGVDSLYFGKKVQGGWSLQTVNATDFVALFGQQGVPNIWYFWVDPFDGSVVYCDENHGDFYKTRWDVTMNLPDVNSPDPIDDTPDKPAVVYDAQTGSVIIREVELVGIDPTEYYEVELSYIPNSNPIRFGIVNLKKIEHLPGKPSCFFQVTTQRLLLTNVYESNDWHTPIVEEVYLNLVQEGSNFYFQLITNSPPDSNPTDPSFPKTGTGEIIIDDGMAYPIENAVYTWDNVHAFEIFVGDYMNDSDIYCYIIVAASKATIGQHEIDNDYISANLRIHDYVDILTGSVTFSEIENGFIGTCNLKTQDGRTITCSFNAPIQDH
ncbi:MAG: hypothetical protein HQK77_01345 [Desulfobacterales bacterium]|nr:hypothetical protein [Desulfobacterales bacterium]